ncbi:MAG: TM0106 family RecB-like putative nuclease [Nitrospirae bacterium]|nr:TM0106 family RecB-like putative nuclease [Nitrospirota bacterium]
MTPMDPDVSKLPLPELIRRATAGEVPNRRRHLRPSWVYSILRDPFWIWCEYHAPRTEAVDESTRYDRMRFEKAAAYERDWVQRRYPEAVRIEPGYGMAALEATLRAILSGLPVLYQPQLWDLEHEVYGKGDLLIRDDSHGSDLGPYHYRVIEIKSSAALQEYHVLQAAFYHRILGKLQGYTPESFTVALRSGEETLHWKGREKDLENLMARWRTLRDRPDLVPEPGKPPKVTDSPWRVYGEKRVAAENHLVLLADVGNGDRQKLREAGIRRVDQLWPLSLVEIQGIVGETAGTLVYHTAQAYRTGEPIPRPGRIYTLPRGERSLYFDFETADDVHPTEPGHVYFIGLWDRERERFVPFLARGARDEERIFREFVRYVEEAGDARLYHWTAFEVRQMAEVIRRWPSLAEPIVRILPLCVDLKEAVKSAFYLPVPTFSIKSVAPALGFHWRQAGFGAFESMVAYWDYLAGKDEAGIRKVVLYNEDDCLAMDHVDRELTRRLTARGN